jgi:FMN phosphatase YigB (HAD superfamily)
MSTSRSAPTHLIFDLDGTLYSNNNGYVAHIRENAERYMHLTLGIPKDQVRSS